MWSQEGLFNDLLSVQDRAVFCVYDNESLDNVENAFYLTFVHVLIYFCLVFIFLESAVHKLLNWGQRMGDNMQEGHLQN